MLDNNRKGEGWRDERSKRVEREGSGGNVGVQTCLGMCIGVVCVCVFLIKHSC